MALPEIIKDIEARVKDTGDIMTGTLSWGGNIASLNLRADHASYDGVISYQTSGNEAMLFTTKNAVTSFMFVNGEDTIANITSDRWTKVTPGLQIKNNSVYIGSLIANGVNPAYKFYVNGTSCFTGKLQVNAPIFGYNYINSNNAAALIWDKPGVNYTGVGANGSADTIYFGACDIDGLWVTDYQQIWKFNGALTLEAGDGINNASKNYISAGRGYSTGSGKNGLKLICTEQTDAISGIGQDCTGKAYELSIGSALSTAGAGYITFVGHKMASLDSYAELGHFNFANSTFYVNGKIGVGTTSPSYSLQVEGTSYIGGLLTVSTGLSHGGIKMGTTYVTSIDGSVIFQNNEAIRFGGDSWDWSVWAGLKYNHSNKYIYLGLADGSVFTANAAQSGGRILTPGISYFHVGNQTSYYFASTGNIYGHEIYSDSWFRSYNSCGWYNETYGCHLRPHDGSYGSIRIHGNARNGYEGLHFGTGNNGMTVMSINGSHQGLYQESSGTWIIYNLNGAVGLGGSSTTSGYKVTTNGSHRITGTTMTNGILTANRGTLTTTASYGDSAIEIREYGFGGAQSDTWGVAPRLSFHWSGRVAAQIGLSANGSLYVNNNASVSTTFSKIVLENGGTWGINVTGGAGSATYLSNNSTMSYGWDGLQYFNASLSAASTAGANNTPTADWYHIIRMNHANANGYYFDIASCFHNNNMYFKRVASGTSSGWLHIWVQGNSVTGAVWNDYAECREADTIEPGYVLVETGDDTLTKSTERLSPFAGVSSDTWGFSQGETDKAKTPIAVAGRVLVHPYQNRNNYKPGDCVCAAPDGKVDIMTREEVIQYPDRIVGTVSSVPTYNKWGGGEGADREPVDVNGRIWIKVK